VDNSYLDLSVRYQRRPSLGKSPVALSSARTFSVSFSPEERPARPRPRQDRRCSSHGRDGLAFNVFPSPRVCNLSAPARSNRHPSVFREAHLPVAGESDEGYCTCSVAVLDRRSLALWYYSKQGKLKLAARHPKLCTSNKFPV
jgi:hypothetical protein